MAQCRILFAFPYSTTSIAVYKTNIRISRKSCSVMLWLTHFYYVTWTDARISFLSFFFPINSFIQLFTFRFLSPATTNFWSIVRCSLPKFGEASISLWRPRNASFYLLFSSWMVNDQSLFFFFRREVKVLGCSSKLLYFNFSSCETIVW